MGIEEWLVEKLRLIEPYVRHAWRSSLKRLARWLFGWLELPLEFLHYCYSQFRCVLRVVPPGTRLTIVIVEPHLGSRAEAVGHELPFSLTVARSLLEHGVDVYVFAHRHVNPAVVSAFEESGIPCQRVFRQSGLGAVPMEDADGQLRSLGRFLSHAFAYAASLTSALARSGVGPPRLLFFPTSGLSCMVGSSLLRGPFQHGSHRESQLHVLHTPPQLGRHGVYLPWVRHLLRILHPTGLHLGTVNPQVNTHLRAFGEAQAFQIPIPRPTAVTRRAPPGPGPRRIGFLGSASPAKGFTLLPEVLPRLLQGHESLRIVVQVNPFLDSPALRGATDLLRRLARGCDRLELVEQPLAMDEYYALLDGIDLIVLPYDQHSYAMSISAVCIEAMALGKVVVGPDIGWFAEQKDSYGGYLAADTSDARQLAFRILEAVEHFERLAERARRDAPKFHWHNVEHLVRILMDLAERDGIEPEAVSMRGEV